MTRRSRPLGGLAKALAVAVAGLLILPALAAAQCPQTTLGEVEQEVMCPVCGTPLALATEAPQAEREREFIVERIEDCQSKEEIKAALVAQYGEGVLATPGGDGFDLLGYLLPALAVLAGASGIAFATFRWRRRHAVAGEPGDGDAAPAAAPPSEDEKRLDRDLERYDL